jgi:hypothetical protein
MVDSAWLNACQCQMQSQPQNPRLCEVGRNATQACIGELLNLVVCHFFRGPPCVHPYHSKRTHDTRQSCVDRIIPCTTAQHQHLPCAPPPIAASELSAAWLPRTMVITSAELCPIPDHDADHGHQQRNLGTPDLGRQTSTVPCLELLFCCLLHTHSLSLSLSFYLSLSLIASPGKLAREAAN